MSWGGFAGGWPGVSALHRILGGLFLPVYHYISDLTSETMNSGDWTCSSCQASNFRKRNACFKCRTSRAAGAVAPVPVAPPQARQQPDNSGDWTCGSCSNSNFRRRTTCRSCNAAKPPSSGPSSVGSSPAPTAGSAFKPDNSGDWKCRKCFNSNFERRTTCRGCAATKPTGGAASSFSAGSVVGAGSANAPAASSRSFLAAARMEPGDWVCPGCLDVNFKRNVTCRRCSGARPAAAELPSDAAGAAGAAGSSSEVTPFEVAIPDDVDNAALEEASKREKISLLQLRASFPTVVADVRRGADGEPKAFLLSGPAVDCVQVQSRLVQLILAARPVRDGALGDVKLPSTWESRTEPHAGGWRSVELPRGSSEFQAIQTRVHLTIPRAEICAIQRIENRALFTAVEMKKRALRSSTEAAGAPASLDRTRQLDLFHGTRNTPPVTIFGQECGGFDMRYSGTGMWGHANYFAVNASYSHSYSHSTTDPVHGSVRQMFFASVVVGVSAELAPDSSLKHPPVHENLTRALGVQVLHDSVKGQTGGSDVFMIYGNDQAYPSYLITYKNS